MGVISSQALGMPHSIPRPTSCSSLHSSCGRLRSLSGAGPASFHRTCINLSFYRRPPIKNANRGAFIGARASMADADLQLLMRAAELADGSAGLTQPHPNSGCVLRSADGKIVAETFQRAQGTESAESQAARAAGGEARGGTAFLNLASGDCHGEEAAVNALLASAVSRVVIGLEHPLKHLRGVAVGALRAHGVEVEVVGEGMISAEDSTVQAALTACLQVNEALLHRAVIGKPLGVLKYAMTLDGKIATSAGHSAWVSCPASRQRVFEARARSDAVVVGGQTVRRDNPRLTTRRVDGHAPARIVMSRTLDLPELANLWDVSGAPTIVMTQRGARRDFQAALLDQGVEVVEFDFLTPEAVSYYCYDRGFLQVLWECGGTLAGPAIADAVIHKALAFIAPKLIGGVRAPTPVGELGNVEMTQAQQLVETTWEPVGPDMLCTGYLPASGGLHGLYNELQPQQLPPPVQAASEGGEASIATPLQAAGRVRSRRRPLRQGGLRPTAEFYKAWDQYGALTNFSPHPISLPNGDGQLQSWHTVEHYYQAQKFAGVDHHAALALIEGIAASASPEEAARLGRGAERSQNHLVRPDWAQVKLQIMRRALTAKFETHSGPRRMLLETATGLNSSTPLQIAEATPHDFYWGAGFDGSGANHLGRLLMRLRSELLPAASGDTPPKQSTSNSFSSAQANASPTACSSVSSASDSDRMDRGQTFSTAAAATGPRAARRWRNRPVFR